MVKKQRSVDKPRTERRRRKKLNSGQKRPRTTQNNEE